MVLSHWFSGCLIQKPKEDCYDFQNRFLCLLNNFTFAKEHQIKSFPNFPSLGLPALFRWKHSAPRKSPLRTSRPGSNNDYTLERSQEEQQQAEKHTVTLAPARTSLTPSRRDRTKATVATTPKPRLRPALRWTQNLSTQRQDFKTCGSWARPSIHHCDSAGHTSTTGNHTASDCSRGHTCHCCWFVRQVWTNQHSWLGLWSLIPARTKQVQQHNSPSSSGQKT